MNRDQAFRRSFRSLRATQTMQIIDMLRAGPQYNNQLAKIALKYTSRISDARKAGYVIECYKLVDSGGLTLYTLIREPA